MIVKYKNNGVFFLFCTDSQLFDFAFICLSEKKDFFFLQGFVIFHNFAHWKYLRRASKLVDSLCGYGEDVFAEEKALLMSFEAAFAFL